MRRGRSNSRARSSPPACVYRASHILETACSRLVDWLLLLLALLRSGQSLYGVRELADVLGDASLVALLPGHVRAGAWGETG